jgi:hypothetical protein
LAFPTGAAAGDLFVVMAAHAYDITSIGSGQGTWTSLDNQTGSNVNGAISYKVLDSSDISRGYVTVVAASTWFCTISGVCFVGGMTGIRTYGAVRDSSTVSSESVSTNASTPQINDYAIYFAMGRTMTGTASVSGNPGSLLQASANDGFMSGVLRGGALASAGTVSATFNYSENADGDYVGIVVVQP